MRTISILLPTRNRAVLLREAIRSVRAQTHTRWELFVIDDQSTDGTAEVIKEFCAIDSRIRVLRGPGRGPAAARNVAFPYVQGQYVAFLDDDDLWHRNKLEQQLAVFERFPAAGMVFTDAVVSDGEQMLKPSVLPKRHPMLARWVNMCRQQEMSDVCLGWLQREMLQVNPVTLSTALVRRELVDRLGKFREVPAGEGYDFWIRLSGLAPIAMLDRVTTTYRVTGTSVMGQFEDRAYRTREFDADILQGALVSVPAELQPAVKRRIVECARVAGWYRLKQGQLGRARKLFLVSLRHKWNQPKVFAYLAASLCPPISWRALRSQVK